MALEVLKIIPFEGKTKRYFKFELRGGIKCRTVDLTVDEFEEDLETSISDWEKFLNEVWDENIYNFVYNFILMKESKR